MKTRTEHIQALEELHAVMVKHDIDFTANWEYGEVEIEINSRYESSEFGDSITHNMLEREIKKLKQST